MAREDKMNIFTIGGSRKYIQSISGTIGSWEHVHCGYQYVKRNTPIRSARIWLL